MVWVFSISSNSTSKTRVELAGIWACPLSSKANSGGITNLYMLPTFIIWSPSIQPVIKFLGGKTTAWLRL